MGKAWLNYFRSRSKFSISTSTKNLSSHSLSLSISLDIKTLSPTSTGRVFRCNHHPPGIRHSKWIDRSKWFTLLSTPPATLLAPPIFSIGKRQEDWLIYLCGAAHEMPAYNDRALIPHPYWDERPNCPSFFSQTPSPCFANRQASLSPTQFERQKNNNFNQYSSSPSTPASISTYFAGALKTLQNCAKLTLKEISIWASSRVFQTVDYVCQRARAQ